MGCCKGDKDGAGAKNVQIKIQDPTRPDDGHGGFDNDDWSDKLDTWAMMRQANGREVFANRQTESRSLYVFEIDYPLAVSVLTTDRILFGTRTFNIRDLDNVGELNRTLKITALEGVPD